LTIAEFDQLPDRDDVQYELHEGELVEVPQPAFIHRELQELLKTLIAALLGAFAIVLVEMPFQISHDARQTKRSADVGVVSHDRVRQARADGIFDGRS
jgi:hypothetical protein